ncbi:MAG TPA: hypothetical protein VK668_09370 [Mucilaginibacter sp.]|nr:hypothetical protein [Mucilaginibacter sp.]
MESEYLEPEKNQGNNQSEKDNNNTPGNKDNKKEFPNKKKNYKVLHKDGSLADMPYNNQPGGGAMEGTVGIGT